MHKIVIGLAQINPTVGALERNADMVIARAVEAAQLGCSVVAFPELSLSGYPPEDLVLKQHFLEDVELQLARIAAALPSGLTAVVGAPVRREGRTYNAAVVLRDGAIHDVYFKMALPNYGVFDEKRVFAEGTGPCVIEARGVKIALHVCEDSWSVDFPACTSLVSCEADVLLNLSASPYHRGKMKTREEILGRTAKFLGIPLLYCNLVGGQDELVFDGGSLVMDAEGEVKARAGLFHEELLCVEFPVVGNSELAKFQSMDTVSEGENDLDEVYEALELGLRDYVNKNGFSRALVALSGGIDSALVAAIAVDALGADRVVGITLPSRFSSSATHSDARELAERLGIEFYDLPIKRLHEMYLEELSPLWPERAPDTTEENLQARIRGNIVMALSNKFGWLVLTTGNKSELATGYCTLYGDMAGGFAALKDVPKTLVFELSRWRNRETPDHPPIPVSIIDRPPSAELRDNQKDEDSLPPYALLDAVIERYVERDWSADRIAAEGYDPAVVAKVIRLIDGNEYKRRQGPPGIKITPKAFGRDRRLPITNQYSERVKPAVKPPAQPVPSKRGTAP